MPLENEKVNQEDVDLDDALNNPVVEADDIVDIEAPASDVIIEPVVTTPSEAPVQPSAPVVAPVTPVTQPAALVLGHGIKEAKVDGLGFSDRALATREQILREERINVILPLLPGEKPGAYKSVSINGWRLEIRKNTPVSVPLTIWNIIAENMKASLDSTANHPLNINNADEKTKSALGLV